MISPFRKAVVPDSAPLHVIYSSIELIGYVWMSVGHLSNIFNISPLNFVSFFFSYQFHLQYFNLINLISRWLWNDMYGHMTISFEPINWLIVILIDLSTFCKYEGSIDQIKRSCPHMRNWQNIQQHLGWNVDISYMPT